MEKKIKFTQKEAQKMYEVLCGMRKDLREQLELHESMYNMHIYQLAWLLCIEETLGRIEVDRLLKGEK